MFLQVVMPTVEADVAFGLGKFNLSIDEVRSRVLKALDAVGMLDYSQVGFLDLPNTCLSTHWEEIYITIWLLLHLVEANSNSQWWPKTKSCNCWCFS